MGNVCYSCSREFESGCKTCQGVGKDRFGFCCECCECRWARPLYDDEGIIRLDQNGKMLSNQTGGVCCHHPKVRGFFQPYHVPDFIKDKLYGSYLSDDKMKDINFFLRSIGWPYEVTGGEEAWLEMRDIHGNNFILTWQNSD